jgi:hypothetical protein
MSVHGLANSPITFAFPGASGDLEVRTPEGQGMALDDEILARAERYAASRKANLGGRARADFKEYAKRAAKDLERSDSQVGEGRIKAAMMPFEMLIDEMIFQKTKTRNFRGHVGEIGEQTLEASLKILCPLWPFCD